MEGILNPLSESEEQSLYYKAGNHSPLDFKIENHSLLDFKIGSSVVYSLDYKLYIGSIEPDFKALLGSVSGTEPDFKQCWQS